MFPLLLMSALIIIGEDGLPFLFTQKRIGKNLLIFKIFKIRTLKVSSPNIGTDKLDDSYRLLSGSIIRKIKLDEFPQLINVLKVDINIVGPRPGLVGHNELLNARSLKNIYAVKPGITGLAQIFEYDMSDPERLAEIDEKYIVNKSLFLDLCIILGTFFTYPRQKLKIKLKI